MKRVAVIGAGIVGSTAAYYLSKSPDVEVTVFDDAKGQATKGSRWHYQSLVFKASQQSLVQDGASGLLIFIRT